MTFVLGNCADFRQWCAKNGITNCVLQGVRHIPTASQVGGQIGCVSRSTPTFVLLPSADCHLLQELRRLGFDQNQFKPMTKQEKRQKTIGKWLDKFEKAGRTFTPR